jgi:hypothetical protein
MCTTSQIKNSYLANIQGEMKSAYIVVEKRELKIPFPIFRLRVSKSWWKRYVRHVTSFGRKEIYRGFWCTGLKERGHLGMER